MLPEGVDRVRYPCRVTSIDDGLVQIVTEDELRVLHTLTGWALERATSSRAWLSCESPSRTSI